MKIKNKMLENKMKNKRKNTKQVQNQEWKKKCEKDKQTFQKMSSKKALGRPTKMDAQVLTSRLIVSPPPKQLNLSI